MFNIKGIDHINMNVSSFDESKEFYKKLFGMKVLEEDISAKSGNKFMVIGIPGIISLCLYESKEINFKNQQIGHFGINIENFDNMKKKLEDKNIEYFYGGVIDWKRSKSIYIKDPSGHEIELTKNFAGGF